MSIKDDVTKMVIEGLEDGVAPWIRGWSDDGTENSMCLAPRNGFSQRPYTGINWLILGMFSPYTSNEWFTANNAIKMTGNPKPISYEEFKKRLQNGEDSGQAMDDLKVDRYCCRRMLLSQVDLIDEVAQFVV